jgi:predicted RecB family nuclease
MSPPKIHSVTGLHLYYYFGHLCDLQLHRTVLTKRPPIEEPGVLLLLEQGRLNEDRYVDILRKKYGEVLAVKEGTMEDRAERTLQAMKQGVAIIHNGVLDGGEQARVWERALGERLETERGLSLRFRGESDLLIRVDGQPSNFGAWSYRVVDVKSSRTGRLPQMMQVAYYDRLLENVQGLSVGQGSIVVFPDGSKGEPLEEFFDLDALRPALTLFLEERLPDVIAEPEESAEWHLTSNCKRCLWFSHCAERAEHLDHLSLVPGLRPLQRRALEAAGIATPPALAAATDEQIQKAGTDGLGRLRLQATAMAERRIIERSPLIDVVTGWLLENNRRVENLTTPNLLSIYLDMRSDFVGGTDFAYAIQIADNPPQSIFAEGPGDERIAFERFLKGIERANERSKGRFVIFHAGGGLEWRLRRLAEKSGEPRAADLVAIITDRLVDVNALLRRNLFFPGSQTADVDPIAAYLGETAPHGINEIDETAEPANPIVYAEMAGVPLTGLPEELAEAALRIGSTPERILDSTELPLIAYRMHLERHHDVWLKLVDLEQRETLRRLHASVQCIRESLAASSLSGTVATTPGSRRPQGAPRAGV